MGENAESGETAEGPDRGQKTAPALLMAWVDGWVKLGAAIYVVGFAVMLVQTSRLNVPAMEVLRFQAIMAGLPIWLVLLSGYWLSGRLVRRMVGEANGPGDWRVSLGAALVIAGTAGTLYVELHTLFGLQLTLSNSVIVVSAIVFVVSTIFVVIAFQKEYSRIRPRDRNRRAFLRLLGYDASGGAIRRVCVSQDAAKRRWRPACAGSVAVEG